MKNRETDYGKGDAFRSNPKKFYENYGKINWSTDLYGWEEKPYIDQKDEYDFIKFLEKKFDMPHELVKGSNQEWSKLYKEFLLSCRYN